MWPFTKKPDPDLAKAQAMVATQRATLIAVRRERDRAFMLLRVAREVAQLPDPLHKAINGMVTLESESDIEDARNQTRDWLFMNGLEARR